MSRSQDPCFILNSFPVGEKSTMLYCFTLGSGVLHLFANITPKKKAMLRSFCKVHIDYFGSGDKKKLRNISIESVDSSLAFKHSSWSYEVLMSAYYLNELILKLLPKEVADEELFFLYERSLKELDALSILQKDNPKKDCDKILHLKLNKCLRSFEWRLLHACGYGFDLKEDHKGELINPKLYYHCEPSNIPIKYELKYDADIDDTKARLSDDIYLGEELIKISLGQWDDNSIQTALKSLMRKNIAYYTNGVKFESRSALQQYFKRKKSKA